MAIPDIQQALDLIEEGKPDEAIPLLAELTRRMPTYVAAHAILARACEAAEQWDEALAAWQQAHFLMPNSPAVQEGLQRVLVAAAPAPAFVEADRLHMDLDLQAELDAELEAALEASFNPFTLPPQTEAPLATWAEDAAEDAAAEAEEEEAPMSVAEASVALVQAALAEAEAEAAEKEAAAQESDTEAASIYEEIEQLIAEKQQDKAPALEETAADTAAPTEPGVDAEDAQIEAARKALAFEAQASQEADDAEDDADGAASRADPGEDLDRLINELEAARIVPAPDLEDVPPLDLDDDIDDVVSETLARIYASQDQYQEAARVYEQLARQQPEQADHFLRQAAEMRAHLASGPGDGASEDDS